MNYEKYELKHADYPISPTKPYLKSRHTATEAKKYSEALRVYEGLHALYVVAKTKQREKQHTLKQQFKLDAFKKLGIEKHSKREKLFDLAWERGHGNGFREVFYYMSELSELIT